jgi:hypothetical protein
LKHYFYFFHLFMNDKHPSPALLPLNESAFAPCDPAASSLVSKRKHQHPRRAAIPAAPAAPPRIPEPSPRLSKSLPPVLTQSSEGSKTPRQLQLTNFRLPIRNVSVPSTELAHHRQNLCFSVPSLIIFFALSRRAFAPWRLCVTRFRRLTNLPVTA